MARRGSSNAKTFAPARQAGDGGGKRAMEEKQIRIVRRSIYEYTRRRVNISTAVAALQFLLQTLAVDAQPTRGGSDVA